MPFSKDSSEYSNKPTRLEIYNTPDRALDNLKNWFLNERLRFIKKKEQLPISAIEENIKLYDIYKRAKVTGTKHPDIAILTLKKVSEDIIDSFDKIEKMDIAKRFTDTWDKINNNYYFTPIREFEEVFMELLELNCDESLIDYEGREIDREWIDLPKKIAIGLLFCGVIPGSDKHILLRIPKLEPISLEGIIGVDEEIKERAKKFFKETNFFPKPKDYEHYINGLLTSKYKVKIDWSKQYSKYKNNYNNIKKILRNVAETNLNLCLALEELNQEYLFSWDDIKGNANRGLIEFLKKKFGIDWVETAKIEKIDDGMTIRLSFKKNLLSLKLNDDKTKVSLKIDDVRIDEFIAKTENGKLNIYNQEKKIESVERLPIYEISIPQINNKEDVDILIKTLREYIHIVNTIYEIELETYKKDQQYKKCFDKLSKVRIVPLIENPDLMLNLSDFIVEFFNRLEKLSKELQSEYSDKLWANNITNFTTVDFTESHSLLRIWLARSDTALNCGVLAAEIARVFAISESAEAKDRLKKNKIANPPDIQLLYGVGLPPFRGGLNPIDRSIWRHYPMDITLQGMKYDMDGHTVSQFVKAAKMFSLQPCFKEDLFKDDTSGEKNLFDVKDEADWDSELILEKVEKESLKRIMAESICSYWSNMSKMGTLIRYMDFASPQLRSRLKTSSFSRENPNIKSELFENVELYDGIMANKKIEDSMKKLDNEWPPNIEPLKLSRAIKLNYFLTNCGIPPTLLDLNIIGKIKDNDLRILNKHIPGLISLIRNDYKLFIPDAAAILLDKEFVNTIEDNTKKAISILGIDQGIEPDNWTEAELNFRDVLLGDVIEHNALLLIAISSFSDRMPVRKKDDDDTTVFFVDKLSEREPEQTDRQLAIEHHLDNFKAQYPANITVALDNMDKFQGDHRWIKVIYAAAKMAVKRGWVG